MQVYVRDNQFRKKCKQFMRLFASSCLTNEILDSKILLKFVIKTCGADTYDLHKFQLNQRCLYSLGPTDGW